MEFYYHLYYLLLHQHLGWSDILVPAYQGYPKSSPLKYERISAATSSSTNEIEWCQCHPATVHINGLSISYNIHSDASRSAHIRRLKCDLLMSYKTRISAAEWPPQYTASLWLNSQEHGEMLHSWALSVDSCLYGTLEKQSRSFASKSRLATFCRLKIFLNFSSRRLKQFANQLVEVRLWRSSLPQEPL